MPGKKESFSVEVRQRRLMKDPVFRKELVRLKKNHSIPDGSALEKMKSTEEGRMRYDSRKKKWDVFKEKWGIIFMIGDRPVLKTGDRGKNI